MEVVTAPQTNTAPISNDQTAKPQTQTKQEAPRSDPSAVARATAGNNQPNQKEPTKEDPNQPKEKVQAKEPEGDDWEKIVKSKKHKVKINDQEQELDYDELKRGYQIRTASDIAFKQGKQYREQAEQFFDVINDENKVFEIIEKLHGKDKLLRKAEDLLMKQIEWEQMPQEQRAKLEEQNKFKSERQKFEDEKKSWEENQQLAQRNYWQKKYNDDITNGLTQANFPKAPKLLSEVAQIIKSGIEYGMEIPVAEAINSWKTDQQERLKYIFKEFKPEQIFEIFPEEIQKALRDHLRKKNIEDAGAINQPIQKEAPRVQSQAPKKKYVNLDEYFENLYKKA